MTRAGYWMNIARQREPEQGRSPRFEHHCRIFLGTTMPEAMDMWKDITHRFPATEDFLCEVTRWDCVGVQLDWRIPTAA